MATNTKKLLKPETKPEYVQIEKLVVIETLVPTEHGNAGLMELALAAIGTDLDRSSGQTEARYTFTADGVHHTVEWESIRVLPDHPAKPIEEVWTD